MRDDKGKFVKGYLLTAEEKEKVRLGIVKSWKDRSDYHGMYHTPFHNSWRSIKARCKGTSGQSSKRKYFDKGITYCSKWETFKGFCDDMLESYEHGKTVDRIDNSKGYSRDNCRWATPKEQNNNRTNNIIINYEGQEKTLSQWAEYLGVKFSCIRNVYYKKYLKGLITTKELIEYKPKKVFITIK